MKKIFSILLGAAILVTLSSCGDKAASGKPIEGSSVNIAAQGAIKKYMNETRGTNLDSSDIEIINVEKKEPYKTKKGKTMENSWFIESLADGVMINAWIDFPDEQNFSITFLNYGIKTEIDDIQD